MIRNDTAATLNFSDKLFSLLYCIQELPGGLVQYMTLRAALTFQAGNDLAQLVEAVANALTTLLLRCDMVLTLLFLCQSGLVSVTIASLLRGG